MVLSANQLAEMSDSPLDSDRTELLRVSDPVDYSGNAPVDLYFSELGSLEESRRRSRQSPGASRPQSLPVDRQWPTRPAGPPPKNIFDDI